MTEIINYKREKRKRRPMKGKEILLIGVKEYGATDITSGLEEVLTLLDQCSCVPNFALSLAPIYHSSRAGSAALQ